MKTAYWIAAAVVAALAAPSVPAQAQTVFAEYTIVSNTTPETYHFTSTRGPSYTGGLVSINVPITFRYDVPNTLGAPNTSIDALLNITSTVNGRPTQADLGGGVYFDTQALQAVTMHITAISDGSNLLSFSNATGTIRGFDQDTSGSTNGTAARGDNVMFTSDYLTFNPNTDPASNNNYVFAFSSVISRFNVAFSSNGNSLDSFKAYGPGSFAGTPTAAPEPSALVSLGVMGGGLALRIARRRKVQA